MNTLKNFDKENFWEYFKKSYPVVLYSNIYKVDIVNGLRNFFLMNKNKVKNIDFEKIANELLEELKVKNIIKYVEKNTYNIINNF
ncbi:MAG TPA: hypothetical protein PLI27_01930 [Ignavibacteriales bacterium]|nr:hypothetical protein [Ignavibacteriales bacterium]HOL80909.1 hypothetical protein [Ignavibacteriales bacterium]HOM64644.1 hypothetical protein [Ignavibacteriales bacterium]HPD66825.1 hypothetical protein [Ignavibacteriales bacterium]HPP32689.1 hypothetical protein [Ignavibacteriales bacterium]